MTITKYSYDRGFTYTTTHFVGRVLEVKKWTEMRNWSDTLDYTDMRSTECTAALVWLGTRFIPPTTRGLPSMDYTDGDLPSYMQSQVRDLEFWEQFAWIDCTNIFADRMGYSLDAEVDASPSDGTNPLMWANYYAWQAHQTAAREAAAAEAARRAEEARIEATARAAKATARREKREKAEALAKSAAEALLVHAPKKGTTTTVAGFTGTVFWTGVSKYYGKYNARVGIKDRRGEVRWIDAAHWAA